VWVKFLFKQIKSIKLVEKYGVNSFIFLLKKTPVILYCKFNKYKNNGSITNVLEKLNKTTAWCQQYHN
jgi:hypothetical protein